MSEHRAPRASVRSPVYGRSLMAVTGHQAASLAATRIHECGGSLVDCAIAASAALATVLGQATSIGGDCFWLMHDAATDRERLPPHWSLATTIVVLAAAGTGAALASDWFVAALTPATQAMHMSDAFAGLIVVAIAGNAVENVVGVLFAAANRPDFAISVILNSSLQVALLLTPVLVFASLFFATTLTLVFSPFLALVLILAALLSTFVVYDGESTWYEGTILIGFYVVVAASVWWG